MREWLANTFLKITSFIYKRKRGLLVSHGFKNFLNILFIIFLEFILTLFSLPLFLMVSGTKGVEKGQVEYRTKKIITFGIVGVILLIWLIKVCFIVAFSFYFDPRSIYKISEITEGGAEVEFVATNIIDNRFKTTLKDPVIDNISIDFDNKIIITGSIPQGVVTNDITGVAEGRVTIYNETPSNQVLIKNTRLLTPDEKLFRLKDRVLIPAFGEIETDIYSDEAGEVGLIDPTGFIIPGLSEDLQKNIYANNSEPTFIIQNDEIIKIDTPKKLIVSVYLHTQADDEKETFRVYSSNVGSDGNWQIVQNQGVFYPTAGDYTISAIVYDLEKEQKSNFSESLEIHLNEVFWERLAKNVDKILNYSVLGFIIIGTILAAFLI